MLNVAQKLGIRILIWNVPFRLPTWQRPNADPSVLRPVARYCGALCSTLDAKGINLSDLDMMIAAHAVTVDATLVSRDKVFAKAPEPLGLEIW